MPGPQRTRPAPPTSAPEPSDDAVDEQRLVAAAQGDRRLFAPLYRRYADPVYRYCYRRLGTREAAEDATSLVFVKALEAMPRYRAGTFRGWLFAIAHNVVADGYRGGRPALPLRDAPQLRDVAPGPEHLALAGEEAIWIRGLLARLPPDQRHLMELRLTGLTDAEIARALGRSHGSVRTAQYRALVRLRGFLGIGPTHQKETDRADG